MSGIKLIGNLKLAPYADNGTYTGQFLDDINPVSLTIKPGNSTIVPRISNMTESYGQALDSYTNVEPPELEFETDEARGEILAMPFRGTTSTMTQASGQDTVDTITAHMNKWTKLSKRNLETAGFTVKNEGGTVTYVIGTDYEVDYVEGMVKPKGSTIIEGAILKVQFDHKAMSGTLIQGAQKTIIRAHIILRGQNMANGLHARFEAEKVLLAAQGDLTLLNSGKTDWLVTKMGGTIETPSGSTVPYTYEEWS